MKSISKARYSSVTIMLHLVIGISFIAMLGLGFFMTQLEGSKLKWQLYFWHKSFGFTMMFAVLVRVLWRLISSEFKVKLKDKAPLWQKNAAKINHILLYGVMILMPASGILMSIFSGYGINVFDLFLIEALKEPMKQVADIAYSSHNIIAYIASAAILLHAAAAFYHHFFLKDNTLKDILPKVK